MTSDNRTILKAQRYLERFGYIQHPVLERFGFGLHKAFGPPMEHPGALDDGTTEALAQFQAIAHIPVTGLLDDATLDAMEWPRCGFPDVGQFVLHSEKWNTTNLNYAFAEVTRDMDTTVVETSIRAALDLWSAASPLRFTRTEVVAGHFIIRFVSGEHGDGAPFDGASNVLAHAFFPSAAPLGGDAHFDDAENWTVTGSGIDLITVAAHEFGHSLGLAHSTTVGALMYPYYGGPHRFLADDDKKGIQALYGAATPAPPPVPPPTPPPPPPTPPAAPTLTSVRVYLSDGTYKRFIPG